MYVLFVFFVSFVLFVVFVMMQELMGARKEQIEQKMRFLAIQAQQERNEFDRVLK